MERPSFFTLVTRPDEKNVKDRRDSADLQALMDGRRGRGIVENVQTNFDRTNRYDFLAVDKSDIDWRGIGMEDRCYAALLDA